MHDTTKEPLYAFVSEEGSENITPVKRKLAKTWEVTEQFNYYDTLAHTMKLEKAAKDKRAEADGLDAMAKKFHEELEAVDKALNVNELDSKWNLELHEKLKAEAELEAASNVYVPEKIESEPSETLVNTALLES